VSARRPLELTPWNRLGPQVPRRGNALTRIIARAILRLFGWRVDGTFPNLPRFVIIAAPHTSNWDFPVGVLAKYAIGIRVSFLGKDSLFRPPLGWLMRWLGGQPVDRTHPHGLVEQTAEAMRRAERFVLVIAPEGTRRRVARWKSGFYRVASTVGVPIVPGFFDYGTRTIGFGPPLWPSGDEDADLAALRAFYRDKQGRHPELYDPGAASR